MNQQLYRRFDEPVNRVNTECIKWDNRKNFGNADALPMWVADMDFRTADGIVDALTARVAHGVFGYCQDSERDRAAAIRFLKCELFGLSFDWIENGMKDDAIEEITYITSLCRGLSAELIRRCREHNGK